MKRDLPNRLAARLWQPLPGARAAEHVGAEAGVELRYRPRDVRARPAAVLILLYPHERRWHVPLTRRPDFLPDHAGQISLPGGRMEPGETAEETAVREFHEELGAEEHAVRLLGRLSPLHVTSRRFCITPVVGTSESRPAMRPSPDEVAELIETPLEELLDPAAVGRHCQATAAGSRETPHIDWGPHRIWGATCLILGELAVVLRGVEV